MPKRPRSHILDSLERSKLHSIFENRGWIVWDLLPDYGEDLLVRIFMDGIATHYTFFVQIKGTDSIKEYIIQDGKYLSIQIDIDHLELWKQFWEPVFLMVYDAGTEIFYWETIQDYLQDKKLGDSLDKSLAVHIPMTNIVDDAGLERILTQTKSRFERFELMSEGAHFLVDLLRERDVEISYTPGDDYLWIGTSTGGIQFRFFGERNKRFHEEVAREATKRNITQEEYILRKMFGVLSVDEELPDK